jgi:hypothetical protein
MMTVGGFMIATEHARYVVTAAHCVGKLPEAQPEGFLGGHLPKLHRSPIGGKRHVWAECVFIDPIADTAVFRTPETQELHQQAQGYEALTEQATPFPIDNGCPLARPP